MTSDHENNQTLVFLRPFSVSHVNFVQFEDGQISHELAPRSGFRVHEVKRIQNASNLL